MVRKLVIVEHNAKDFENRLWNDLGITACGFELGARVVNRTSLEHMRLGRPLHWLYARIIDRLTRTSCGRWTMGAPKFLPPTVPASGQFEVCRTLYFFGWLFRNPAGLAKYRDKLVAAFAPKESAARAINDLIASVPRGRTLVGIHIRQKPFKGFGSGEFLVPPVRVRQIVEEYLCEKKLRAGDVALVIATDESLPAGTFSGLASVVSVADAKTNLFLLSRCSVVIGTNSRFANLAAWFSNVPHIVTMDNSLDWEYYKNKNAYFENKYATFTHG